MKKIILSLIYLWVVAFAGFCALFFFTITVTPDSSPQPEQVNAALLADTDSLPPLKLGDEYLMSFDWENKDPFEPIEYFKVKVIGVSEGFVKYSEDMKMGDGKIYTRTSSTEIAVFRIITRPLSFKKTRKA